MFICFACHSEQVRRCKTRPRALDDPIRPPRGLALVTLDDAGTYITKLPKTEHEAPERQASMEAPILVATRGGSTMLARIGVLQALKRHHVREFNPRQRERHCGRRKLARDRRPCPRSGGGRRIRHIRRRWGSSALTGFWFQARVMRAGLSVRASSSLSEPRLVGSSASPQPRPIVSGLSP